MPLREKRRIAAFVCADWHPNGFLPAFLRAFPLEAPDPETALRQLLVRFPFLPIDAGDGADRVIAAFAERYISLNGRQPSVFVSPSACTDDEARSSIHVLLYSIIMLNTDLHNPAISPKISEAEYQRSCRCCPELRLVRSEALSQIYAHISAHPLQIAPNIATVDSILRSSPAGETASPAQYSIYSSLLPSAEGHAARQRPHAVAVDWNVAYWNLVEMCAEARSAFRHRAAEAVHHATSRASIRRAGVLFVVTAVGIALVSATARGSTRGRPT